MTSTFSPARAVITFLIVSPCVPMGRLCCGKKGFIYAIVRLWLRAFIADEHNESTEEEEETAAGERRDKQGSKTVHQAPALEW